MQEYANENLDLKSKLLLKSLLKCGKAVVTIKHQRAVAVVRNNKTAKYAGLNSCKSAWCCPVCSARQMSKYAAKIACAIDALKERDQVAAMVTLTVPHTSGFTCEQTTEILYNVWKAFTLHGNKILAASKNDIFSNCMAALESKHRVRVCEYTWGQKGWHPHFHCLLWFPRKNIDKLLEWEERLNQRWLELCKRYTIRQLLIGYPKTQRKTVKAQVVARVNIMYSKLNDVSKCVYISQKDNKVIVQESSTYLCGWGGDKELTGNVKNKATKEGHYTWQQILEKAINGDPTQDWWKLYFEYAIATRKYRHARINFSVHSGLCKIITEHKNTVGYREVLKKNATDLVQKNGKWRVVCWFTVPQWQSICSNRLTVEILELAMLDNAIECITALLSKHQIPPPTQNPEETEKFEKTYNAA